MRGTASGGPVSPPVPPPPPADVPLVPPSPLPLPPVLPPAPVPAPEPLPVPPVPELDVPPFPVAGEPSGPIVVVHPERSKAADNTPEGATPPNRCMGHITRYCGVRTHDCYSSPPLGSKKARIDSEKVRPMRSWRNVPPGQQSSSITSCSGGPRADGEQGRCAGSGRPGSNGCDTSSSCGAGSTDASACPREAGK
jgi:hypothetical protein